MADLEQSRIDRAVIALGRRNESSLLGAARKISHTLASQRLGISKQTQSEWLQDNLRRAAQVCAAYGVKWVPATDETMSQEHRQALLSLSEIGLSALRRSGPAVVEDDEITIPGALGDH